MQVNVELVPELTIQVDDETAEDIIDDIDDTVASSAETWEFRGDLEIPEALKLKTDLMQQLDK